MKKRNKKPPGIIGWREWVGLPDLEIPHIKAKVDTGAKTSSLHAFDVQVIRRQGKDYVRFKVHPVQHSSKETVLVEAPLLEFRKVRSSSGHVTRRPVIRTRVRLLKRLFRIDLTLASRDAMGFRMLLGREALSKRFLVDSAGSFLAGIPRGVENGGSDEDEGTD